MSNYKLETSCFAERHCFQMDAKEWGCILKWGGTLCVSELLNRPLKPAVCKREWMPSCKIKKKYWDNISHSNSNFRSSSMINKCLFHLFLCLKSDHSLQNQNSTKTFTKKKDFYGLAFLLSSIICHIHLFLIISQLWWSEESGCFRES